MGNMLTFAESYRRCSLEEIPFCIADSLILSQIAYYNYAGSSFEGKSFGKKLCDFYRENPDIILKGMVTAAGDKKLIEVLALGGRHGDLRACCYVDEFSAECEKQFSAITFRLGNGEYYIAFRGTDNSVVGWKEDFALSFQEEIGAQKAAVQYAADVMRRFPGKFYIGGHSKGGNLAVYSAMSLGEDFQKRIKTVYNFDGPGFLKKVYENAGYRKMRPLICKVVPQSSIIGMMLETDDHYRVVYSMADAITQHDPYTWELNGNDFEYRDVVDVLSGLVKRALDGWLEVLPVEERKKIINTVFDVVYNTGINWFYEISEQRFEKIRALLNSASNVDPEERKRVFAAVKRLLSIAAEELHQAAREGGVAQLERSAAQLGKGTAQLKELVQFEKKAAQLERRANQLEKFLQSIQRGDWNKFK